MLLSGLLDHVGGNGGETEVGTPGLQLKTQFVHGEWGAVAAVARMEWPGGEQPQYTAYGVLSRHSETMALDATLGGVFSGAAGGDGASKLVYAFALAPILKGPVGGYAEIFGERASGMNPVSVDFGLSYALSPRFIVDAAVVFGLNAAAADWQVQVGMTSVLARVLE